MRDASHLKNTPHPPYGHLLPQGEKGVLFYIRNHIMKPILKIGIVAGEASGDLLGAGLITELKKMHPELHISGLGGPHMIRAGCQSIAAYERLSVMGLIEPLFHLRDLFKLRRELIIHFLADKPDVFIGIDSPDFNLGLEQHLRQAGIPIVHYVSPSVWAWRQKRIHKIAKTVDLMLTLLPFEAEFYRQHHVPVAFVGHPLADSIPLNPNKPEAREQLGLSMDVTYVALLPGSRQHELKHMAKVFLQAAALLLQQKPHIQFITSAINAERDQEFKQAWQKWAPSLPLTFFQEKSHAVLAAADVVLVTSGTATLETLLFKRPMVIAYKTHALTYQIAKRLVKIPYIGLPNLLAQERLVPEFIQDEAKPLTLASALNELLDFPQKRVLLEQRFLNMHQELRANASYAAALAVTQLL